MHRPRHGYLLLVPFQAALASALTRRHRKEAAPGTPRALRSRPVGAMIALVLGAVLAVSGSGPGSPWDNARHSFSGGRFTEPLWDE